MRVGCLNLVLLASISSVFSAVSRRNQKLYDDHRVVRAHPESKEDHIVIERSERKACEILKKPKIIGIPVDYLCSNDVEAILLQDDLSSSGVRSEIDVFDFEPDVEDRSAQTRSPVLALNDAITFDNYYRYGTIKTYLERLESNESYSSFLSIDWSGPSSVEGRPIPIVKIGKNANRAVYIDAGIHAREWIASASALYFIDQLLRLYTSNDQKDSRLDVNWFIFPLLNPDGYEYTHEADRMWRKNRAKPPTNSDCYGVDLNRNYDVVGYGVGASDNPCDETYKGTNRSSEPEVRRATEFLLNNKDVIGASISLHSYGQLILTSWGYTNELPSDNDKLIDIGNRIADAIKRSSGRIYKVGPAGVIFYAAGGASDDFAKARAEIPFSATIELPDTGSHRFILPDTEIESVGQEVFSAMKVVAEEVKKFSTSKK